MLAVGWATILPIFVFLCLFFLDLSAIAKTCQTRHELEVTNTSIQVFVK